MTYRGTSNSNSRGSSTDRRRRREYLIEAFRADVDLDLEDRSRAVELGEGIPCAPCYLCGELLTVETVTVDRIKPGIEGGTYERSNIRPACGHCNSSTGGILGNARKAAVA